MGIFNNQPNYEGNKIWCKKAQNFTESILRGKRNYELRLSLAYGDLLNRVAGNTVGTLT
jgi:hypothetical protein